jgi:hypothetical protein
MKQSLISPFMAAALVVGTGFTPNMSAYAQTARPADAASMVRPPAVPGTPDASGAQVYNPDNMPVKRPSTPPNAERMLHHNPASDAIAK